MRHNYRLCKMRILMELFIRGFIRREKYADEMENEIFLMKASSSEDN